MSRAVRIPDDTHPITITPAGAHVRVRVGGVTVAETDSALSLAEAGYPAVQYIPAADVDQSLLTRSDTRSYCPFKGDACYYTVTTPDGTAGAGVIWCYERPHDAVKAIAGHMAFYPGRAEITVTPAGHGG
jgi:uncharacterized protein (DUF427 family)